MLIGAIGVGIYLRSFVDFGICVVLTLIALYGVISTGSVFALFGYLTVSSFYAYHRVQSSNGKLMAPVGAAEAGG